MGLLEADLFHAFALFLDSSIDMDGYPAIVLEREDLSVHVESADKKVSGVLIYFCNYSACLDFASESGFFDRKMRAYTNM
ncbi:MAG: hypothetical protein QM504_13775 [Pseudomonadota bacterium]